MTLVKIGDDEWTRTGIKSTFRILIPDDANSAFSGGANIICGLGWRFSCFGDPESTNQAITYVGPDGGQLQGWRTLLTWRISVFFDPHLIRSAEYGRLSFSIVAQHLRVLEDDNHSRVLTLPCYESETQIGTYFYDTVDPRRMTPTIAITVGLPASTGLSIPRSIDGRLERTLTDTMSGKEAVDLKFYAFTRKSAGYVTHPQAIFAQSALLERYSDSLDLLISGEGFSESNLVDLDRHHMNEDHLDDYDYMSDSDLDTDDEGMEDNVSHITGLSDASEASLYPPRQIPLPLSRPETPETPKFRSETPARRMGRVVILKGTAFKTWRALVYYLYTSKLSFSSAPHLTESQCRTPQCSAKSMYRLADQLGLDELKAISLSSIHANLSQENIIKQVFSKFTSTYPEVQNIEVEFVLNNFSHLKGDIDSILESLCNGDRPYCVDVLRKIVAGRNS
ncbi:hypothetical protein C8R45DRAFT_1010797 [Mycena sanguinolenta]|nr:hypothetical protein C8R45DRAFT_1010797 [Mycena sanguinolenta]